MNAQAPAWVVAWSQSEKDPLRFACEVLGFLPYGAEPIAGRPQLERWQTEYLKNFFVGANGQPTDEPRHSVRSGHGTGKTTLIAILALWFPLTHYDSKCVVTAASQDQLRDGAWSELRKWANALPAPLRAQIDISEERLSVAAAPEMGFVVRRTASKSNPEALQGIHAKHVLYLVDEASGIDDIIFEVAAGSLSTKGAIACLFSNPTRTAGYFFDTHHKLRERWRTHVVNCEDVPRARGHIEDVIAAYGRNSNRYRVRVLGEFPTRDDDTVIPLELVEAAQKRTVQPIRVKPIWGVDVARFGDDASALAKRQGNLMLEPPKSWHGLDGVQLATKLWQEWQATPRELRPSQINIDVIGYGASCFDHCKHVYRDLPVYAVNVAESAADDDKYHRLRDELWFRGFEWFKGMNVQIPAEGCEKLISQLTAPTYDYSATGQRVVESKKNLKKRGIPSPDEADSLLNTFIGIPEPLPLEGNVDWGDDHGGGSGWTG